VLFSLFGQRFPHSLMRKVTIAELCAETGMEEEFIKDVIEVTGGKIEFLDLGKES